MKILTQTTSATSLRVPDTDPSGHFLFIRYIKTTHFEPYTVCIGRRCTIYSIQRLTSQFLYYTIILLALVKFECQQQNKCRRCKMAIINKGALLEEISKQLDISPSMYKLAVERYESIAKYLQNKGIEADFYPQGSFRLGTVTRPIKNGKDSEYDIDLVCHMTNVKAETKPSDVKHVVGDALKQDARYRELLDDEGRRCWTLLYADIQDIGYHLDILPSVGEDQDKIQNLTTTYGIKPELAQSAIAITNKSDTAYSWASSNPRGYANWFDEINGPLLNLIDKDARKILFESNRTIFASIDDVPSQLIRTPLQRVIQILKRHRDVRFAGHKLENDKPISMVITILASQIVKNEQCRVLDTFTLLNFIVTKLSEYADLIANGNSKMSTIQNAIIKRNFTENRWYIPNPINPAENFADRWHENNNQKAKAFFDWIKWVQADLVEVLNDPDFNEDSFKVTFGNSIVEKAVTGYNSRFPQQNTPTSSKPIAPTVSITSPGKPYGE